MIKSYQEGDIVGNNKSKLLFDQWKFVTGWISAMLDKLGDDELKSCISKGRNHGVWILGHLIESEDELSKFLGKDEMLYPDYKSKFGQGSELLQVEAYPPIGTLREQWKNVTRKNEAVLECFTDDLLEQPHALIEDSSEEDFFKTKGRCIMIWNIHQMFHGGQLNSLNKKEK